MEAGLRRALEARGLDWGLKQFKNAWDAWDARAARTARTAWTAWDAWDAWDARAACDAWVARADWTVRAAWAVRTAWAARAARAAWAALTVYYASRRGWVTHPEDLLTVGVRGAYRNGLAIALPTGPDELGWVMEQE